MKNELSGFCDEMLKIAVSREAATHSKTRVGRRSIRVHNLLKHAWPFAAKPPPTLMHQIVGPATQKALGVGGTMAGGALLYHMGKKKLDEMRIGHQYLKAQGRE